MRAAWLCFPNPTLEQPFNKRRFAPPAVRAAQLTRWVSLCKGMCCGTAQFELVITHAMARQVDIKVAQTLPVRANEVVR
jgi:hypothetical protein